MKNINLCKANKIKAEIVSIDRFMSVLQHAPIVPKQYRRIFAWIKIETQKKFSLFGTKHFTLKSSQWDEEIEVPASVISDIYRLASDKKKKLEAELLEVLKKEIRNEQIH